MDQETLRILKRMLTLSPKQRPSCKELLEDEYFKDLEEDYKLDMQQITGDKIKNLNSGKEVVDLDGPGQVNNDQALLGKRTNNQEGGSAIGNDK